ncbi:spore coat protein, partial [Aquibacillus salsiterrae]
MLKTVDVGLMANHLSVHNSVIKKLERYASGTQNQQLIMILEQQAGLMKNHTTVMNNLLNPNQNTQVSLPPIPEVKSHSHANYTPVGLEDKDIAIDAHLTAMAMSNDNFTSALNMKDPQIKKIHIEMALQQSHIADQLDMLAQQNGWMSHPNATAMEQTNAQ